MRNMRLLGVTLGGSLLLWITAPPLQLLVAFLVWSGVLAAALRFGGEGQWRVLGGASVALLAWLPAPVLVTSDATAPWLIPLSVLPYLAGPPLIAWASALIACAMLTELRGVSGHFIGSLAAVHLALALIVLRTDRRYRRAERTACRDPLTGVGNRRALRQCLDDCRARARRSGLPMTLVLLDIDHFKMVNDRHGHAAGDRMLCRVTKLCSARLRPQDRLFRYGGEEFIVVLPDTPAPAGHRIADALREALVAATGDSTIPITLSAGVAELTPGGHVATWLSRADAALYRAKRAGRNRVAVTY